MAVDAGTSWMSFPHSSTGRLEVMRVERFAEASNLSGCV